MMYLDPKSDMVFKKLFGNSAHKNILMSFLNSVLERGEGLQIVDVVINDPSNVAETPLSKASIVDVRCTDQQNNQYIIEMQVISQKDYAARAQYYSALALGRQLGSGEKYEKLVPVIFVGILNFALFETKNYISHHIILDNTTYAHELKHLEFHFIELKKFTKELEQLNTILDKWIYFLKHADNFQEIPDPLKNPIMKEAFNVLAQGSWSIRELEAYDRYLDSFRSSASQLETAEEIGMAKGRAQGIEEGREQGELKKAIETAQELLRLNLLDSATIAKITGLSIEKVEELKKQ